MENTVVNENEGLTMSQFKALLLDTSVMVLSLKSTGLAGIFVGDLLELLHIESERERVAWLKDIFQDLSENSSERYANGELKKTGMSISDKHKMLLEEVLKNFDMKLEEALKQLDHSLIIKQPSDKTYTETVVGIS